MWEADPGDWWRDLEVHVRGAFNCCRAVLPGMVERRRGRFLHAEDDLDELLAGAGRVAAEDLLTLRLREWPGS